MDTDNDALIELDRAKLLKLATASLVAVVAAGSSKVEAANAKATHLIAGHPFTLVYVQSTGIKLKAALETPGLKLTKLVITNHFFDVSSATIWFEMDDVVPSGTDETVNAAHPNPKHDDPGNNVDTMFVGLWFDMGSHKLGS